MRACSRSVGAGAAVTTHHARTSGKTAMRSYIMAAVCYCCACTKQITGQPAKYRDPLTGYPYADAAAFKELRKRYGAAAQRKVCCSILTYMSQQQCVTLMLFVHVLLVSARAAWCCSIVQYLRFTWCINVVSHTFAYANGVGSNYHQPHCV